jgi:phosphatidylglycerol:prolipoprotein diacylglycerol transferase
VVSTLGHAAQSSSRGIIRRVIDPIALQLGPISIHWYGIIMATAILAAAVLGTAEARRRGENPDVGWSLLLWAIAGGVIGARLYHVIHQWSFYSANPSLIPQVWNGGLGIPGAVAGGAAAIWLATRLRHLPTARWFDIFVMALPLGQAIGRLGNFVNQELYGPPTTLPWGIPISAAHRVAEWGNLNLYPETTTRFHPLFAYEAIASLITLGAMIWISRRFAARLYDGDMLLIYIMFYGVVRSYLETFRVENWIIAGIPTATWLGLGGFVLAGGILILRHVRGWGTPGAWIATAEAKRREAQKAEPAPEVQPG